MLHNLVVTRLLAEAHSGYDLPWMTHRAWPRVFGGAKAHDAHHVQGDRHFHRPSHSSRPWAGPARLNLLFRITGGPGVLLRCRVSRRYGASTGAPRHRASPIRRADLGIFTVLELVGVAPGARHRASSIHQRARGASG